eukprot:CAMPEP_0201945760 /NCGR_PEP_ID=MMETSP0903-20130614/54065_1 /ASSEMBLY_ACC=CAM_ASM_000552 /TAXON_ID=420261 /ORGANISM="Thalassiosira antarctica, Strain CCMP982" /LENGTH=829 /DNA_ID=CAMNT_0048488835 /DNA_START=284 /DNA_END=2774 /DNA_ORIENTATION=-
MPQSVETLAITSIGLPCYASTNIERENDARRVSTLSGVDSDSNEELARIKRTIHILKKKTEKRFVGHEKRLDIIEEDVEQVKNELNQRSAWDQSKNDLLKAAIEEREEETGRNVKDFSQEDDWPEIAEKLTMFTTEQCMYHYHKSKINPGYVRIKESPIDRRSYLVRGWIEIPGNEWAIVKAGYERDYTEKIRGQDINNLVSSVLSTLKTAVNEGRDIGAESTLAFLNLKLRINLSKDEIQAVAQKAGLVCDSNIEVDGLVDDNFSGNDATIIVHSMPQYSPLSDSGASQQEQSSFLDASEMQDLKSELVASLMARQSGGSNLSRQISNSQEPLAWPKSASASQSTATTALLSNDLSLSQSLESEIRSVHSSGTPRSESMENASNSPPENVVEAGGDIGTTIDADDAAAEGYATANLACLKKLTNVLVHSAETQDWESQLEPLAGPKSTLTTQSTAMTAPSSYRQSLESCQVNSGSSSIQSSQNNDNYKVALKQVRRKLDTVMAAPFSKGNNDNYKVALKQVRRKLDTVMAAPFSQRQGKGSSLGAKVRDEDIHDRLDSENRSIGSADTSLLVSPDILAQDSPAAKVEETRNLQHQLDATEVEPLALSKSTSTSQITVMAAPFSQRQGKGSPLGAKVRDEDIHERLDSENRSNGSADTSLLVSPDILVQPPAAKANKETELEEICSARQANSFQRAQKGTRGVEFQKLLKEDKMLQKRERALKKQLDESQNTRRPLANIKNQQTNCQRRKEKADKPTKKKNIKASLVLMQRGNSCFPNERPRRSSSFSEDDDCKTTESPSIEQSHRTNEVFSPHLPPCDLGSKPEFQVV